MKNAALGVCSIAGMQFAVLKFISRNAHGWSLSSLWRVVQPVLSAACSPLRVRLWTAFLFPPLSLAFRLHLFHSRCTTFSTGRRITKLRLKTISHMFHGTGKHYKSHPFSILNRFHGMIGCKFSLQPFDSLLVCNVGYALFCAARHRSRRSAAQVLAVVF